MRRVAYEVVQRACLFSSLAIFCTMIGMSFEPRLAFQSGGTLTAIMALVLIYKAREALTKPYNTTELWLYLPKDVRPPPAQAVGSSRVDLQACKLEYSIVSPK